METNSLNPNHPLTLNQIVDALKKKRDAGNNFAGSLVAGFQKYGNFTEKQRPWAEKLAREEIFGNAARASVAVGEGFKKVQEMFILAKKSIKHPKISLQDSIGNKIKISLAPDTGNNAGFIYVKSNEEYAGKISPQGEFFPVLDCSETIKNYLKEFAENPVLVAKRYGHETGNCCFCARLLTDNRSVTAGFGPICASRFGLNWG